MPNTIDDLANRQFRLTFLGGIALTPVVGLAIALLMYHPWADYWSEDVPPLVKFGTDAFGLSLSLLGTSILPALLTGWLRLAPMRWLFKQTIPRPRGFVLAMAGTFLLFEATVVAAALLGGWMTKTGFKPIWSICTGFSLPWLLAALWATQRVLRRHAY